jgi:hypothetical protein
MKKLALKLEDLRVESFDTDDAEGLRGTVRAMSDTNHVQVCNPTETGECTNCFASCYQDSCMTDWCC